MTLRGTLRILVSKWYVVTAGVLLSAVLAGVVYALVPAQYTASGVAVLVRPRQKELGTNSNPLLTFESSLSTTALILIQDLDSTEAAEQMGIRKGLEKFTVEQSGADTNAATVQVVQPFISVKATAATPERTLEIIGAAFDRARQNLVDQQRSLRVLPRYYIRMQDLGVTASPKRVLATTAAATGAAFLIGLCLTFGFAMFLDWAQRRRAARRATREAAAGASAPAPTVEPHPLLSSSEFVPTATDTGGSTAIVMAQNGSTNGSHDPAPRVRG